MQTLRSDTEINIESSSSINIEGSSSMYQDSSLERKPLRERRRTNTEKYVGTSGACTYRDEAKNPLREKRHWFWLLAFFTIIANIAIHELYYSSRLVDDPPAGIVVSEEGANL